MDASTEHSERVATRLGDLHVRIIGAGRMTVLWSSMFVDGHTWDPLVPFLARGTAALRRFVLIDPPGLGLSEPLHRRSTIEEAADAARDALEKLGADGPVDWVGNAFGGHVGMNLARDATAVRSLVSISSPTEPISADLRRKLALLGSLVRVAGVVGPIRAAIVDAMLTKASAADPHIRRVVVESLHRPNRASVTLALRSFIIDRTDVTDRLGDIRVPALFLASDDRGEWSRAGAERAAALTPDATALTISGSRTLLPLEQPAPVAEAILGFWAGLPEAVLPLSSTPSRTYDDFPRSGTPIGRGTRMAGEKGKGSDTAKRANTKASKEGKKNPRTSSSAQAELGKKGGKSKKKS